MLLSLYVGKVKYSFDAEFVRYEDGGCKLIFVFFGVCFDFAVIW